MALKKKIPRPYAVNNLELIFSDVAWRDGFESERMSSDDFGCPRGSYVYYTRSKYGYEKHSYIHFAAVGDEIETMRTVFFEFAKQVPGKYEGTEIK